MQPQVRSRKTGREKIFFSVHCSMGCQENLQLQHQLVNLSDNIHRAGQGRKTYINAHTFVRLCPCNCIQPQVRSFQSDWLQEPATPKLTPFDRIWYDDTYVHLVQLGLIFLSLLSPLPTSLFSPLSRIAYTPQSESPRTKGINFCPPATKWHNYISLQMLRETRFFTWDTGSATSFFI